MENDTIKDYLISDKRFKDMKNEYNRATFRNILEKTLEPICVNCGSTEKLSFHHIVPLSLGGTNNISNIVRLCPTCHDKAHIGYGDIKKIGIFKAMQRDNMGRKKLVEFNDYTISVLHRYFKCEIGTLEAKSLLGMSPKNRSTWNNIRNEYKKIYPVPDSFKNKVDLINSQSQRIKTSLSTLDKGIVKYNEEVECILHRYFRCEIGMKESKELIGINPKTQEKWYNLTSIYKEKFNIPDNFKNLVDVENIQDQRIKTTQMNILKKKEQNIK